MFPVVREASDEVRLMKVPVYNIQGSEVGSMTIDEKSLGSTVNASLIKQAYVMYHANTRQGSARSKKRSQVEGTTKKMYKQKGTGSARHGDKKVAQMRGGGHAHSKKRTREDFHLDMPKKMRRKANRNALLAKLMDNEVRVLESLALAAPKTKDFSDLLQALKIDRSALLALSADDGKSRNVRLSARNVGDVTTCRVDQLTCFNMLNNRYLVISKEDLEGWLKGPSSQTGKAAKVSPMGAEPAAAEKSSPKPDARRERAIARREGGKEKA